MGGVGVEVGVLGLGRKEVLWMVGVWRELGLEGGRGVVEEWRLTWEE